LDEGTPAIVEPPVFLTSGVELGYGVGVVLWTLMSCRNGAGWATPAAAVTKTAMHNPMAFVVIDLNIDDFFFERQAFAAPESEANASIAQFA